MRKRSVFAIHEHFESDFNKVMNKKRQVINVSQDDRVFLLQALAIGSRRAGYCTPNPAVGALLVKEGQVLATGCHWRAGLPHAEVLALSQYASNQQCSSGQSTTLYVTLEPCCHQGKTPPCTQAIIRSSISRVVFAHLDPNPKVSGHGMKALQNAGIDCQHLVLPEIQAFYRSYDYWTTHRRPWVTLKLAISADEKIATANRQPINITSSLCHHLTQQYREHADGILTTARTILSDDPQLNVRRTQPVIAKPIFILDRQLRVPKTARIFKTAKRITVYYDQTLHPLLPPVSSLPIKYVPIACEKGLLNLTHVLNDIGAQGIHDLWVEAGARCF